jgi:hypothetical protein
MVDQKTTELTAITTFSGDETFYVVEDDDGTPVSRKVTVEDMRRGMIEAGQVVQVVRANSTTLDSTTSAALQASSLSCTITPRFSDSLLMVEVSGECSANRDTGSPSERRQRVAINNTTDAVELVNQIRGRTLVATSSASAPVNSAIGLRGFYTVNSTTARTFQLQHCSIEATNVISTILGTRAGGVDMTITEIRA